MVQAFRIPARARNVHAVNDRPKSSQQQNRERRLSAALRENLRRRKAQAKARAPAPAVSGSERDDAPHDSAGIVADKRRGE
jgi:hypothetical protein